MKKIFTLVAVLGVATSNAQFNPLVSRNARFNLANTGRNTAPDIRSAHVKEEHLYLIFMDENTMPADSLLVSSNFYNEDGTIASSVDYDNGDSAITQYSYRYNNGKLVEKNYTILFNNEKEGAFKVLYNENGQEELIYQYLRGLDTPLVYKKEYNKQLLPYRFWATSPNNNNFSLVAAFQYFSDNSLKKAVRYSNDFFPMETSSESIKVKSSADNKKETVYINDEKRAFYEYNDKGQCTKEFYQDIFPTRYLSPSLTPGPIVSGESSLSPMAVQILNGPAPVPTPAPVVYNQTNAAYISNLSASLYPETINNNNTNVLVVSDNPLIAKKQVADYMNSAKTADAWNNGTVAMEPSSKTAAGGDYWKTQVNKTVFTEYNDDGTIKNTTITDYIGKIRLFVKNNYTYYL